MILEFRDGARDAVTLRIGAAAVRRPIVEAQLTPDEPGRLFRSDLGCAQGDVRLARAEITNGAGRIELDHDFGVQVVKFGEDGCDEREAVYFFGRDLDRTAKVARVDGSGAGEIVRCRFDLPRTAKQVLSFGRECVARLPFVEQLDAERL